MSGTKRTAESSESDEHLRDLDDGCGCVEVWEHLSAERGSSEREGEV